MIEMMKNDKLNLWQVLLPLLPLLMLLASCRKSAEETADNLRIEKLHQLDELLNAQSPQAKTEIEKGMKLAKDSLTFYEYYARKGRWFCQSATPDSTVGYVDRTLRFALRQPDTPRRNGLLAYTYNCQGINYHNFHSKADEVVSLYQSAYAYSMRSDVQHQAPSICANLGDAYLFKNQLPQAASWYRRALFLVDSLQLPKEENVSLYVGLATIYLKLNDFDASLQCYQQTEDHLPQMSLAMQAYYLNNYGNYYYYKKDYAQSLRKFLQLKQLLEKHKKGDCFDMYLCKLNMADVYLNLDSIAQSEKYLAESEPFMVANHDREAVYYCNTIHIGQEVKKGDMAAVTRILDSERRQFGEDLSNLVAFNLRQIRNQYLQRYYLAKGDYRMAFENLRRDMQKNDSLEHNRIKMRASEIMDRFTQDTLKLHHDLVLEHKTAQLHQTRFIALAVVLLILLLCMFFVIKSMRSGKRLEESRHRILQLKLEGARNRISPHFVFNVLNNKILHAGTAEADELMGLARLIRSNLDLSCQPKVSLAAEIGFVKQYLAVETPLMGDDFDFSLQIDPEVDVENTYIPSMFVQILVENALVHGLRGWEGRKILQVKVDRKQPGYTVVSVLDNGRGFDIRQKGKKRTGLGIITQTLAVVNEHNRRKMTFSLQNRKAEDGSVAGCLAQVCIPDGFVI